MRLCQSYGYAVIADSNQVVLLVDLPFASSGSYFFFLYQKRETRLML